MRKATVGLGFLWVLLALFAQMVGLAHNARWGSTRVLALLIGVGLLGLGVAAPLLRGIWRRYPGVERRIAQARAAGRAIRHTVWVSVIVSILLLAGIGVYFTWFASHGLFPTFRRDFNPYVDLGESFLHGQLSLPQPPDPRLAQIDDPWNNIAERSQIPYTFDLSYYHGRYYLYWGPVPALVYAGFELITGTRAPDPFGMLLFGAGLAALLALLLFLARRWCFPCAPAITIPLFVMAAMLNLPVISLVMHSNVYETAVITGQFFLFLGLVGWLAYLHTRRKGWLVLTGLGYGLAVGSRFNLLFSVAVFVLFALVHLYRQGQLSRENIQRATLLFTPLALVALGLSWYNAARFGSPLQMGYIYQLAKPGQTYQYQYAHMYGLEYVSANLYYYLLSPLTIRHVFPYFISALQPTQSIPHWVVISPFKRQDQIMYGLMFVLPVFWLLAILIPAALPRPARMKSRPARQAGFGEQFLWMCFLSGLVEFIFLMIFYFAGERYILDFSALWMVALALGAWRLDGALQRLPRRAAFALRAGFWTVALLLALATALIGVLSGFDLPPQPFRNYNPAAFDAIRTHADVLLALLGRFYQGPSLVAAALRWLTTR